MLEERVRIARELHDVVAHHVSVMGVQAGVARRLFDRDPAEAVAAIGSVETAPASAASAAATRTFSTSLSPAAAAAASTAGVQASTIVLSPDSAFPRATIPSRAAWNAEARVAASMSDASPSAVPARRKAVP